MGKGRGRTRSRSFAGAEWIDQPLAQVGRKEGVRGAHKKEKGGGRGLARCLGSSSTSRFFSYERAVRRVLSLSSNNEPFSRRGDQTREKTRGASYKVRNRNRTESYDPRAHSSSSANPLKQPGRTPSRRRIRPSVPRQEEEKKEKASLPGGDRNRFRSLRILPSGFQRQ